MLPVKPTPPWLKLFTQALDPWDDEDDGDDGVRQEACWCQGHSSLDAPSELNPPQRIPSPLYTALLVPQAKG